MHLTPNRVAWVEPWPGTLCCVHGQDTLLRQPLFAQEYKWVPANLMLGVTLWWTNILSRGEWKYSLSLLDKLSPAKFFEPVQIFQPKSVWYFCLIFASNKKYFWHLRSFLHLHSTYLTYYSLPALPTSQPLFFLSQCLPCEPWTTDLWLSFGFMSWCLTSVLWSLGRKFPYFFNYIYTVLVIHFLKLFKWDNVYVTQSFSVLKANMTGCVDSTLYWQWWIKSTLVSTDLLVNYI